INVEFAVLGPEESCTGDPAKRAGNEFVFQMMALTNIEVLNAYEVKKIVTACPHCFNTLKNEYPNLGGNYEVIHHTQFLKQLMEEDRKSTRLNSSHVKISYAVFCLKKKNETRLSISPKVKRIGSGVGLEN